jgi:acyl carrier protein
VQDEQTARRVRAVIESAPNLRVDVAKLSDHDDLFDAGLKSLAMVHLMLALEDEFGIAFPDSVLHRGSFATVWRICLTVAGLARREQPLTTQFAQ